MARVLANTKDMPIEEWRNLRRNSIGGSDAATVLGLNKFSSTYTLWADKKGLLPEKEESEAMRIGHDLEQYVAERWAEATGKKFRKDNNMYLHDKYDFISANIDRKVVGENAGLECKTTNAFNKSDFENGEIPLYYYCQCMHYMNVMGFDRMYLAVLVMGKAFYHFIIDRNESEIEALEKAEIDFWENYIEKDEAPEVDGSDSTKATLDIIYPNSDATEKVYLQDRPTYLNALKKKIKELQTEEKQVQNEIIELLGGCENGYDSKFTVTYKPQSRSSLDTKKLKTDHPDIYEKYAEQTTSKVMRLKEVK